MNPLIAAIAAATLMTAAIDVAHAADKHLFYVHGCCVKDSDDPKAKVYETVVRGLADAGLTVAFELRPTPIGDSDEKAHAYAAKIAARVRSLLAAGTAPEDITVAGYSLGSMTTMVASGLIAHPKVNFVLIAGCPVNSRVHVTIDYAKVMGRVLSIVDSKDDRFGSCAGKLPGATPYREIMLNTGQGHGVFADLKYLDLWRDPLLAWTSGR